MTILNKEEQPYSRPVIDLTGPDGNAFALMGYAKQWAKQCDYTEEHIDAMLEDMMSGDYEHLLDVIDQQFGDYVDFLR